MNTEIEEKLKTLPDKSGVYIMHNSDGDIIYVGKAKNLKNRVRSYFKSHRHPPKVASMVANVEYFEYIITDSELEALVLENNLIKQNMPKYNILLKDDKTYPFLKITLNEDFPRILLCRRIIDDGAAYYGPYQSSYDLKQLIMLLKDIFKLRSCNTPFEGDFKERRPCLYYQLGKCRGVCCKSVGMEEYRQTIEEVIDFVNGKTSGIVQRITDEMKQASVRLDFETAKTCRDRLSAIELIGQKQKIVNPNGDDTDAISVFNKNNTACVQLFFIRSGKMIGREHYFINDTDGISESEIISDFVRQYYETSTFIPNILMLEQETDDTEVIRSWLSAKAGRSVKIKIPKIGESAKLIKMIKANAKKEHSERELKIMRDIHFKNAAISELGRVLNLKNEPMHIEAYDISNMGNDIIVASMVVYKNGKPYTKGYKNFKIKDIKSQDDYASMREVIRRRFVRALNEEQSIREGSLSEENAKFLPMPDCVFADGGEKHMNAVKSVLDELDIDIPVFGIVKDDNHRTRAVVSAEGEIQLDKKSEAFMLLVNIQDEMHRRAITYLRNTQNRRIAGSELNSIAGVGDKRRKILLKHFKSIQKIKDASLDELCSVDGIDKKTAENIFKYFGGMES